MTAYEGIRLTPMMEQWLLAKNQHEDAILLFRMGDFYELFGDDAITAAPILELALTSRDKDKSGLKMAGFPFHAADNYIAKLIDRGHKVAICDQLEDPKLSRGIVKRGITNVLTPGTAIDSESGQGEQSFLVALICDQTGIALCALDLATATFKVTSSSDEEQIIDEVVRILPKEVVVLANDHNALALSQKLAIALKRFLALRIEKRQQLSTSHLKSYVAKISLTDAESKAASLVLSYLCELKGQLPSHLDCPKRYSIDAQLLIDESTRANLDLFPKKKGDCHNLFIMLDDTKTVMGRRALFQAIKSPSTSMTDIEFLHDCVEELLNDDACRQSIRDLLPACHDLEKLTALLASNRISPRGMAQLRDSLITVENVLAVIKNSKGPHVQGLLADLPDLSPPREMLVSALVDEPPLHLRDGGIFKKGYDPELDELMMLVKNSKDLLLDLEARERKNSAIPSLKIKFTRVFGYYIEITRTHLEKVPSHYQRKQTVANGERYITAELSELEMKMSSAEVDALAIEEKRFLDLLKTIADHAQNLMLTGRKIAQLDVLACFSELASLRSFVRPKMRLAKDAIIDIREGRHPIVEEMFNKEGNYFVPNDVILNKDDCSLMLITGPNMAGKSTIMRQVALIQIMAQIGSFVPARTATLSICDAIFARVGASDDLATGRSTFMVEMSETAAILKNASISSLILLDEIGRGTSTYDGLSIAQAVAEYIHDNLKTRTLFATHYHELTKLEHKLVRFKNFHVQIDEGKDEIRFLHTLGHGPCLKSFGIQVAHLSGLPKPVLMRAQEILLGLECEPLPNIKTLETTVQDTKVTSNGRRPQLDLFHGHRSDCMALAEHMQVAEKIQSIDIDRLTPLQALNKVASWQNLLRTAIKKQ